MNSKKERHFFSLQDFDQSDINTLLEWAQLFKQKGCSDHLKGKVLLNLFLNPSLRTRVSMESAMKQMGGSVIDVSSGSGIWPLCYDDGVVMDGDAAEHVKEAVNVLGQYGDLLAVRSFVGGNNYERDRAEPILNSFALHSPIPLINLESSLYHPCQALADWMTIRELEEKKDVKKIVLTWAWHPKSLPNAVPNSFLLASSRMGKEVVLAHPEHFDLDDEVVNRAQMFSQETGGSLQVTHNLEEAYADADVVYAKSWGSRAYYGQPDVERAYKEELRHWMVDQDKMAQTGGGHFMHCLPVRRNVIVSDEVLDSAQSVVIQQAGNRLHVQKAIINHMLGVTPF